jgi:hypothetical protein
MELNKEANKQSSILLPAPLFAQAFFYLHAISNHHTKRHSVVCKTIISVFLRMDFEGDRM